MMTPEEFKAAMENLKRGSDCSGDHIRADGLMCDLLRSIGYGEGVEIFIEMEKWYA